MRHGVHASIVHFSHALISTSYREKQNVIPGTLMFHVVFSLELCWTNGNQGVQVRT